METAGALPSQPAAGRVEPPWPRFDAPNVLWFFGFYAITFASIAVINEVSEAHHDLWEFLVSLAFAAVFLIAALGLRMLSWRTPSGLAVAMAVAMIPAAGFGFTSLVRTYPHEPFFDPFQSFSGSIFGVALASAFAALVAFALTRFSFILLEFALAVSLVAQFFLPAINDHPSDDAHAVTAIVTGAALIVIGLALDGAGRRRAGFWFHVIGFLNLAIAFGYYAFNFSGDTNRGWIPMSIIGGFALFLAAPLWRATWAFYGVLGFYIPIFHWLTSSLQPSSLGYAFILLGIGVSIFIVGFALARLGAVWLTRRRAVAEPAPPT
jgi:hypothetical protein